MSVELKQYPAKKVTINQEEILSVKDVQATPETVFNGVKFIDNSGKEQIGTAYGIRRTSTNSGIVNIEALKSQELIDLTENSTALISLTIEEFETIDADIVQEWQIMFTTGASVPTIVLPEGVKWATAQPIYETNKTYWLSFIQMGEKYLGIWTVIDNE